MAKISFGSIVADARNSAGGTTYTKNHAGNFIRRHTVTRNPRSAGQATLRANFTGTSKAWSATLTGTQRAAWITLANANPVKDVFGVTQTLTGAQMFQRLNRNLFTVGVATETNAPATITASDLGGLAAAYTGPITSPDLKLTPTNTAASTDYVVIAATGPLANGRAATTTQERIISIIAKGAAAPYDVTAAWLARLGPLMIGKTLTFTAYTINGTTGGAGTRYSAKAAITS